MAVKAKETAEIRIEFLQRNAITLRIIGTTPLFQNRMAEKARQQLLIGGGKKTAAQKKELKHNPIEEFRNASEILRDGPTLLGLRTVAIKAAMSTAAIETAGVTKTSAQRLIYIPNEYVSLYGIPQLRMDVVRSADMNRTPDIRTRPFIPKWGAEVEISYIVPQLSVSSVTNLLFNAGILIGVGDFRQEKGKGSYGSFRVIGTDEEDAEWDDLVANHGRYAQEEALLHPVFANSETAELMEYFFVEQSKHDPVVKKFTKKKEAA